MSDEKAGGLKNAIIGLITIIVTAIAGVIGKKMMGGDEKPAAVTAPAAAAAPNIIINNTQSGGGHGGDAKKGDTETKDGWTKKAPKW